MRTGDAEVTLWLNSPSPKRHWCLQVISHRRGKFQSPRWQVPVYRWSVELWGNSGDDPVLETPVRTVKTFAEAMRRARRAARKLERQAALRARKAGSP